MSQCIGQSLGIRDQFKFAHPVEVLTAVRIYCCDHYGSMIWDLGGEMCNQYFNAWNTCVKLAWKVPRSTHNYFLDYLSGGLATVKNDILGRYGGFYRSLLSSPCREVSVLARVVARDVRSTTAKNLKLLKTLFCGLTSTDTAVKIRYESVREASTVPVDVAWKLPYLGKLLEQRDVLEYGGRENSMEVFEIQQLIDSLCSS